MKTFHFLFIFLLLAGCAPMKSPETTLGAGFRYSSYGPPYNPGPEYWASVGEQMAAKFTNAKPATIWIVGILDGEGTYLSFGCEPEDPNIRCGFVDINEQTLTSSMRKATRSGCKWSRATPV